MKALPFRLRLFVLYNILVSNAVSERSRRYFLLVLSFEFWVLSFGFWVVSFELWVLSCEFWVVSTEFWVLSFEFWVVSFEFWVFLVVSNEFLKYWNLRYTNILLKWLRLILMSWIMWITWCISIIYSKPLWPIGIPLCLLKYPTACVG